MATDIPIQGNDVIEVSQITPVDLSGVRDAGMRALVLLAASLGWNVIKKINNPIALVARDGTQRRLPTNTSVRMSVFQSALSTIMAHTYDRDPQPELIDRIVAEAKVDRDHERRLRLAIGESAEEHKKRLANERAAEQKRKPDEHLTQHIEVPVEVPVEKEAGVAWPADLPIGATHSTHDGQNHGLLVSREPFVAHHSSGSGGGASTYISDTSFERTWSDGYKDYECMICGKAYRSPKGVGAHRQVHTKAGEAKAFPQAWERSEQRGKDPDWIPTPKVEDLAFEPLPSEHAERSEYLDPSTQREFGGEPTADQRGHPGAGVDEITTETADAEEVIDRIAAMVAPRIMASRDMWKRVAQDHEATIHQLQTELGDKTAELQQLQADWDALRGLIDGR